MMAPYGCRALVASLVAATLVGYAPVRAMAAGPSIAPVTGVEAGNGSLVSTDTRAPFIPLGFTSIAILYPAVYADSMCKSLNASEQAELGAAQKAMVEHGGEQFEAMKTSWFANTGAPAGQPGGLGAGA